MIGVLHTARINAIEFIVSSDKLIEMVNFKLGDRKFSFNPRVYASLLVS